MGISSGLAGNLLGMLLTGGGFTAPASVHAGLLTAVPDDVVEEVAYTGYSRVQVAGWTAAAAVTGAEVVSAAAVVFAQAGSDGDAPVVAVGLFDDAQAGTLLFWAEVAPVAVTTNTVVRIPAGALTVAIG